MGIFLLFLNTFRLTVKLMQAYMGICVACSLKFVFLLLETPCFFSPGWLLVILGVSA
jgi:hypothetical protein